MEVILHIKWNNLILVHKPQVEKTPIDDWQIIRERFVNSGFDVCTTDILMSSWRDGTKDAYKPFVKKWVVYASQHNVSITHPTLPQGLAFLSTLFKHGSSYSQINIARSTLSTIIDPGVNYP